MLHFACYNGDFGPAKALIDYKDGKKLSDSKDAFNWTPFKCAFFSNHFLIARILVKAKEFDTN